MADRHEIELSSYPRREHFLYFRDMPNPYVGLTAEVDITDFLASLRAHDEPFFLSLLYRVCAAANAVPALRQRIVDGGIVEYDCCDSSHTLALEDGTYCYCRLRGDLSLAEFLLYARAKQAAAAEKRLLSDSATGDPVRPCFL